MNDQKIYEFIALNQPVRAVQLADKFDVALVDVSASLRSLVDVGDLVRRTGVAPNGQPAQEYSLSESFLKSKEGKLVFARLEDVASIAPIAPPAPALPAAVQPMAMPSFINTTVPVPAAVNRTEVAIAHIKAQRFVSDADLRVVMGLKAGQYPSAWLATAYKNGVVKRDGKGWVMGDGAVPAPAKKQPAFGGALNLPGATPHQAAKAIQPTDAQESVAEAAGEVSSAPSGLIRDEPIEAPKFRCALWSDGVLELQRDGVQVAALTQCEGDALAAFIARLQQPAEAAI